MYELISYLGYWLKRSEAHGLHAPFVFDLYTKVIGKKPLLEKDIEVLRANLKKDHSAFSLKDYGAGSKLKFAKKRSIANITKTSSTPAKFSALLRDLVDYLNYSQIIELGTSLGINSLYLSITPQSKLTTFEGDPTLAGLAQSHFQQFKRSNVQLIEGNIDQTLPEFLKNTNEAIDLAYIDANHRFQPTMRYYEAIYKRLRPNGMIVIDDIHWSKEMYAAWKTIKERPEVTLSIDLFEAGLLYFDVKLEKQDYILTF